MGHKKEAARPVYGLCCCRAGRAVGLSGSCQAVRLGPDSDGAPLMSGSAVRLSDTCCQAVRESAVNAVRLSGTVRRCPGFAVRLSDQGSADVLSLVTRRPSALWLARVASAHVDVIYVCGKKKLCTSTPRSKSVVESRSRTHGSAAHKNTQFTTSGFTMRPGSSELSGSLGSK